MFTRVVLVVAALLLAGGCYRSAESKKAGGAPAPVDEGAPLEKRPPLPGDGTATLPPVDEKGKKAGEVAAPRPGQALPGAGQVDPGEKK